MTVMAQKTNNMAFKMKKGSPMERNFSISPVKNIFSKLFKKATPETKEKRAEAKKKAKKSGISTFEQNKLDRAASRRTKRNKAKVTKVEKEDDVLTKNIKDTSQKGDEAVRPKKVTVDTEKTSKAKKSANNSVGVKKSDKVDHDKNLKGKKGVARRKYYDKYKLAYDKTISFGPNIN